MKLYEISSNYLEVQNLMDNPDVSDEAIRDTLEAIEGEFSDKVENCVKVLKNRNAEVDALKAEIDRLTQRKRALENRNTWLKQYMMINMEKLGISKVKSTLFTVSRSKNSQPTIVVNDERKIPTDFYEIKAPELSTMKLKEALVKGAEIPGVELQYGYHLNIR